MKHTSLTVILLIVSLGAHSQNLKGPVKLVDRMSEDEPPVIKGKSGPVTFEMRLTHGDFFSQPVITPHPNLKNSGDKKVQFNMILALFDAAGVLISGTSQATDLDPNQETQQTFLINVPDYETWKKVASYQLTTFNMEVKE